MFEWYTHRISHINIINIKKRKEQRFYYVTVIYCYYISLASHSKRYNNIWFDLNNKKHILLWADVCAVCRRSFSFLFYIENVQSKSVQVRWMREAEKCLEVSEIRFAKKIVTSCLLNGMTACFNYTAKYDTIIFIKCLLIVFICT